MSGPIGKAQADFAAGAKDEALYGQMTRAGELYRNAWQQCRRDAEAKSAGLSLPSPAVSPPATALEQPATGQNSAEVPEFIVSSIDPEAIAGNPEVTGEGLDRFRRVLNVEAAAPLKEGDMVVIEPEGKAWPHVAKTAESAQPEPLRIQSGEEKPKKPKPANPDQLDLFG